MLIIPAIDLRGGRVVRLWHGDRDEETVYSGDPVGVARCWEERGAQWLHVVDLDGAFSGRPRSLNMVRRMVKAIRIPIESGGGMRSLTDIERAIETGVERVILGSVALADPKLVRQGVELYGERIMIAIDAREGRVYTSGWERSSASSPLELAQRVKSFGVERVVYTDISRDGTMGGPDVEMTREIAQRTGLKVIASGGISTLQEIEQLERLGGFGVEGAIIGKALYEGIVGLEEAMAVAEGAAGNVG